MQVTLALLRNKFESWKHLDQNLTPMEVDDMFRTTSMGKPLPPQVARILVQSQEDFKPLNVEGSPVEKDMLVQELGCDDHGYFYVVRTGDNEFDIFHTRMFLDMEETRPVIYLDQPLEPFQEWDNERVYLL